jgi:hypothetical protein
MAYRICLPLPSKKGQIFLGRRFCIDLPQVKPPFRIPDPGPLAHLDSLATIVALAESLPETLPARGELQNLANRALEAAAADLGDDIKLERLEQTAAAR